MPPAGIPERQDLRPGKDLGRQEGRATQDRGHTSTRDAHQILARDPEARAHVRTVKPEAPPSHPREGEQRAEKTIGQVAML